MAMAIEEMIGLKIDKIIEGTILGNSMVTKSTEIEV